MYIYIAGPLFNDSERELNNTIDIAVRNAGYSTYLPQRDGGESAKEMQKINSDTSLTQEEKDQQLYKLRQDIFISDIKAIERSDMMIAVLDGRVPDEGTCVEIGIAFERGIPIIGYKTDERSFMKGLDNIMIAYTCSTFANNLTDLIRCLDLYKTL